MLTSSSGFGHFCSANFTCKGQCFRIDYYRPRCSCCYYCYNYFIWLRCSAHLFSFRRLEFYPWQQHLEPLASPKEAESSYWMSCLYSQTQVTRLYCILYSGSPWGCELGSSGIFSSQRNSFASEMLIAVTLPGMSYYPIGFYYSFGFGSKD